MVVEGYWSWAADIRAMINDYARSGEIANTYTSKHVNKSISPFTCVLVYLSTCLRVYYLSEELQRALRNRFPGKVAGEVARALSQAGAQFRRIQ